MLFISVFLAIASPAATPEEFEASIKKAQAALAKPDLDEARMAAKSAFEACGDPPEGGVHAVKAKALLGEIELKLKHYKTAAHDFKEASQFALDDHRTRAAMLKKRRAAWEKAADNARVEAVDQLVKHDAFVLGAMRRPANPENKRAEVRAQISQAIMAYKSDGDPLRAEWAAAVRALVSVRSNDPDGGLAEAKPIADNKKAVRMARIAALEAIQYGSTIRDDIDGATRAALALNALVSEPLPEERRRYARMKGLDVMCTKYESQHGTGSCTRLERETTGRYSFTDLSVGRARKELSDDDLDRAHRQFLPALEDCVLTSARNNRDAYQSTDIQISWAIQPKGQASDVDIKPKRYQTELMPCVEERIAWLRYPRYTSPERKTVTIPYHLD
jgi:hypothetical protein